MIVYTKYILVIAIFDLNKYSSHMWVTTCDNLWLTYIGVIVDKTVIRGFVESKNSCENLTCFISS